MIPDIPTLCDDLDAVQMLSDCFIYPEEMIVANAYGEYVNDTIRMIQRWCECMDYTLPISETLVWFNEYFHLGYLCQSLAPKERSQWEEEQASCKKKWQNLCESKGYPETIKKLFESVGDETVGNFQALLDELDDFNVPDKSDEPDELDELDEINVLNDKRLLNISFSGKKPAFTIYWHLCYLCDILPDGPEKSKWEAEQLKYLASEQEQDEREEAATHAEQVKTAIRVYQRRERDMGFKKYYYKWVAPKVDVITHS